MLNNLRITKAAWLLPLIGVSIALMAVALWTATSYKAQAQNAKNTGLMTPNFTTLSGTTSGWTQMGGLDGWIQTSEGEDVVYDVSLECGLYTETLVKSKGMVADTSKAEAMIEVRVLVDSTLGVLEPDGSPKEAQPGIVKFCSRAQTLMAVFNGSLDGLTAEQLSLILETVNANAFNYFSENLKVGEHHIQVQARITTDVDFDLGGAVASALVGKGTVAVDEVKFANKTP